MMEIELLSIRPVASTVVVVVLMDEDGESWMRCRVSLIGARSSRDGDGLGPLRSRHANLALSAGRSHLSKSLRRRTTWQFVNISIMEYSAP